jgi:thioredoxin reductase
VASDGPPEARARAIDLGEHVIQRGAVNQRPGQHGVTAARLGLQRAPFLLKTTTPGMFAAGDVRHDSMKRVATAVADGSTAIRFVHDYLAPSPHQRSARPAG